MKMVIYTCHDIQTVPKKPCEPKIEKSIFSLNKSRSVGNFHGIVSVSEQVETLGNTPSSENRMAGATSPNPMGGMELQPVKKTITSVRVGELWPPWAD